MNPRLPGGRPGYPRLPGPRLADAERRLYELLAVAEGNGAHSAYNALTRRLVSYLRAADRAGAQL